MKPFFSISVEGVDDLKKDFDKYKIEASKAVNRATDKTAVAVRNDAVSRLKGLLGSAKHWIGGTLAGHVYNNPYTDVATRQYMRHVGNDMEYAPYIEFGTGDVVFTNFDFSEEAKREAEQYKGAGIRKVNIRGDSFLNWAAVNQSKKHSERVVTELNKITKL